MLNQSTTDLQEMVADTSSCAVLGLMIRIMSNPELVMGGSQLCTRLIKYVLEFDKVDSQWNELVYAMAGDKSGSYFLESVFECCELELFLELATGSLMVYKH